MPTMQVVFLIKVTSSYSRSQNVSRTGFVVERIESSLLEKELSFALDKVSELACERAQREFGNREWEWVEVLSFQILSAPSST